ncbi:MAG TPA: carbohydrate kinase family protein [Pyrinomonadaceae bacterium]|nr:carbohydrate kinase family protein [Pyrinomonadaceae bacterium]
MSRLSKPRILVVGELNVDIVVAGLQSVPKEGAEILARDCELTLGSASAIFAVGMSKLGHPVTFVSQVGKDSFGDFCISALKQSGVSTRNVTRTDEKTGVTVALSSVRDRALVTFQGAISTLTEDRINRSLLQRHQHLHLTSYYLQQGLQPSFADLFRQAKALGLTTSFDPNSDPAGGRRSKKIDAVLRHTDVLFVNECEASNLTGMPSAKSALKSLGKLVPCAVVKLGHKGAIAIKDNQVSTDSGFKIRARDTTGAGDSFDAGFISAYLRESPISECLRIGNACGALSALRVGGTAGQPTQQELEVFLRSAAKRSR